jgi:hypothetical protein
MEATISIQMLVTFYQSELRHIPEDGKFYTQHRCENFKSHKMSNSQFWTNSPSSLRMEQAVYGFLLSV